MTYYVVYFHHFYYELPTRLLDWSYNVSTAVYFACSGVFRKYKWSSPEYKKIYLDDTNSQNRFMVIIPGLTRDLFLFQHLLTNNHLQMPKQSRSPSHERQVSMKTVPAA
ncbi:FRG domain-containing protein [Niabella hirudinis]|uniref:FRG domain-containing protein n=1 Tax=Niabella hirudinis TaxID=1285929 RepID=UPI003EB81199